MPGGKPLNPRARTTFKALESLLNEQESVTPMHLARELYSEETALLGELEALLQAIPESIQVLQPDDVSSLQQIAGELESGKRRSLKRLVEKITCAPLNHLQLERSQAVRLAELLAQALTQDVQNRVHELRVQLEARGPDAGGLLLTVTRAPYRFTRVPMALGDRDIRAIRALYPMLDRLAWKSPPSCMETVAARLALRCLRRGVTTGEMLHDNDRRQRRQGVPKCWLSEPVRNDLDWVVEVCKRKQTIFEIFYEPYPTAWGRRYFCFLASWAEPHAPEIVTFLLAAQNEILQVLNKLFQSIGAREYPLVEGHDFPEELVPPGSVPSRPVRVTRHELVAMYRKLREIGIMHMRRAA
jgi:hypothetical protein